MEIIAGYRDGIIDALSKTVEIFTSHFEQSFDEVMSSGLKPIADAVGLNRIAVYRILDKESGQIGQIYVWANGKTVPLDKELVVLPNNPPVIHWLGTLTKGECINGNVKDMPKDRAGFLSQFGVKSIFFVPIFTHGEFWGIVTLEDHTNYRYFDEDCLDLLRSAAWLCANAFIRNEMTQNANKAIEQMKYREELLKALNNAALSFLSQTEGTYEATMTSGVKHIVDAVSVDRLSVWRNSTIDDKLHITQIYRWHREAGGTTVPVAGFSNVLYSDLVPSWEKLLANNETLNGPVYLLPEAKTLISYGMVSAFITPVFINNEFWGFVIFEDHQEERYFDEESVKMLRSAAFLCVSTVIRAEMERDIIDANEFNRVTIGDLPIGFTVIDDNLRFVDCNDSLLKILETDKEYLLNHFYEFSPEYQNDGRKSGEKIAEVHRRALNGEKFRFPWEHRSSTGRIIPFEISLTRTVYKGRYIVLAYQYDLTNIKKMEHDIREQSELLKLRLEQQELISEISRGFISSGDSETYVKEAIAKLGHYLIVTDVLIFRIDYQANEVKPAYHWSSENKKYKIADFDIINFIKSAFPERLPNCATLPIIYYDDIHTTQDETLRPLLDININALIITPLYVEGRLWGVMSVEQRHAPRRWSDNEKSFVALTAGTIAGVIMRNIYNTMLKEALDKATIASQAKGEFLSNMSHEMRTPLNAIIGMTAIGKTAVDLERKDYALRKIEDASTHLLGVINDVLDMSKIEANKLELSDIEFAFEKMLQKTIAVINFRVEEKHQKLTVNIDRAIPAYLIGDDQRLTQIITNLLSNAVKFTPDKGSINLDARLLEEKDGLCVLQISVTDTGIGITPEQKSRLFQSFQQAEASTVRKYGGSGLGLAICKNIVNMMGGKIWVESEVDKGSAFTFTVKMKRSEGKIPNLHEYVAQWEDIRILVVDDDPDILDFFVDILKRYNLHCDTALSGDDALRLVEKNGNYNVYFIDWKMPGIDGITLSGALKSIAKQPDHSVVIMISAAEWTEIEADAKKAGVQRFLSKPLFPSSVADTICECLGVKPDNKKEEAGTVDSFEGHRIMLVEDVEINREIVLTILEPMGLEIHCAENGIQAVDMYCNEPDKYELIFMDVHMPEMDGYEATRKIRDFEKEKIDLARHTPMQISDKTRSVPIIAMTANVFKEDIEKCINAGMDDHIGKPLDFEVVIEKLRTYLK